MLKKKYLIVLLCLVFLYAAGCTTAQKKPLPNKNVNFKKLTQNTSPKKAVATKTKLKVTTFSMEDRGALDPYPSLVKYHKQIDTISPLWYTVQQDGSIRDKTNRKTLGYAQSHKIKVIPLVNVAGSHDEVLVDKNVRDRTLAELDRLATKYKLDGYNIDFEFIPDGKKDYVKDKDLMTEFMKMLRDRLKPKGKEINMSVIPHYQVPQEIGGIYDYSKLAPIVDHVTLMLYDRHQESGPPGPVAPSKWVEDNVKNALQEGFKPSQICMGVATYGYDWPANTQGGFSAPTKEILAKAKVRGVEVKWDDKFHEPYYIYKDPNTGTNREVWFESSHTLKEKIQMAKKYNVMGICMWRLGFETASYWDVIGKEIKK